MLTIIVIVLCAMWGYQQRPATWPLATIGAAIAIGVLGFLLSEHGRALYGLGARDPATWLLSALAINGLLGFGAYGIGRLIGGRRKVG
jgi:phosphatidylglycerophosphate synthase